MRNLQNKYILIRLRLVYFRIRDYVGKQKDRHKDKIGWFNLEYLSESFMSVFIYKYYIINFRVLQISFVGI